MIVAILPQQWNFTPRVKTRDSCWVYALLIWAQIVINLVPGLSWKIVRERARVQYKTNVRRFDTARASTQIDR